MDPGVGLLLLFVSLGLMLAGAWQLLANWAQQASLADRTALDVVEARAGKLRYRLDVRLRRTGFGTRIGQRLAASGVEMRLIDFLLIAAGIGVLGYLAAELIFPPWLAVVAGAFCVRGAWAWVDRKRAQRVEAFAGQLPEVARVISNGTSAGLSMVGAIEMAAAELDDPAGAELVRVVDELRVGQSLEGALESLERRMPSRELGVLITTLIIQQRAGGDAVRALQDMADTLESRKDLIREVRTVMSGSIFTSYLVAGMGIVTVLLLNLASPGVIEEMTSDGVGRLALIGSAILYATGFVLVRRVTRIET